MDVDEIAEDLYGLPPGRFTTTRNGYASAARLSGDRGLVAEIAKLRRPTRGAWLVNAVVRSRTDLADELVGLGESMRQAQRRLAGDELRRLSLRRATLVQELTSAARQVAGAAGEPVSGEMERELQATVEAALADPAAAAAVRAGRLVAALSYAGLGSVGGELDWSPAPAPAPPAPAPVAPRRGKLERAREVLRAAEAEAASARRAAEAAQQDAQPAAAARARVERRMAELESELATLRASVGEVARVAAERAREERAATRALRVAEERLTRARRELARSEEE